MLPNRILRLSVAPVLGSVADAPTLLSVFVNAGGWNAYLVSPSAMGLVNPVSNIILNSSCERALSGWPCDPEMEKLRDQFARETDPAKLKEIAEAAQLRAFESTPYVHLGEWRLISAARKNVTGFISAGPTIFWNVEKK